MQILVKRRGDRVLDGRFYRMGSKSSAEPFTKSPNASAIISWMPAQLSYACAHGYTAHCFLSKGLMFPAASIRVRVMLLRDSGRVRGCDQHGHDESELDNPSHSHERAIALPLTCGTNGYERRDVTRSFGRRPPKLPRDVGLLPELSSPRSIWHRRFGDGENRRDTVRVANVEQHAFRHDASHVTRQQIDYEQCLPTLDLTRIQAFLLHARDDSSGVIAEVNPQCNELIRARHIANSFNCADTHVDLLEQLRVN